MSRIVFRPKLVTIEYNLYHADGRPFIISDAGGDAMMGLPFVDNYGNGFGSNPAEVYITLDHPKEIVPSVLIDMQKEIIEVLEEAERRSTIESV